MAWKLNKSPFWVLYWTFFPWIQILIFLREKTQNDHNRFLYKFENDQKILVVLGVVDMRQLLLRYLSSFRNSFSSLWTVWRWHWKFYKQSTIDTVEVFRLPDFEYWLVRGSSVSLGSGIKVNYPQLSLESDRYTMMDRLFRSLFCFPWSWL